MGGHSENTSSWEKVRGKIQEVAGRATGNDDAIEEGEARQRRADQEQAADCGFGTHEEDVAGATGDSSPIDPLAADGEMGQGGGRQFDPDPLRPHVDQTAGSGDDELPGTIYTSDLQAPYQRWKSAEPADPGTGQQSVGSGREFEPSPLGADPDPDPNAPAATADVPVERVGELPEQQENESTTQVYDRDPGRPDSQEDRDVQHRSRRTEAEPGWIDPGDGTRPSGAL